MTGSARHTNRISLSPELSQIDDTPIGLIALWQLLWRNKLRIVIPALVLAAISAVLVFRTSDTFTAEAQLILTRGNLEIIEFTTGERETVTSGAVSNAQTILNSRNLAVQVIDRLDLTADPDINPNLEPEGEASAKPPGIFGAFLSGPDDDTVLDDSVVQQLVLDWLSDAITITPLSGTNVIVLRASTTDPAKSAQVANAYADLYLDYQLQLSQRESERAADALEQRVNDLQIQLEADQVALQNYRVNEERSTPASLDVLAAEARNVRQRLADAGALHLRLQAALDILGQLETSNDPDILTAFNDNAELFRLQSLVGDGAPTLDQLPEIRSAAQQELDRTTRLQIAWQDSLTTLEARINQSNAYAIGLRQLEVELATTSGVYEASLARLKELTIQTGIRDAGAQILAQAVQPLQQDRQGRRRIVLVSAILGLLMGAAYVLLREAANDRIRKVSDLIDATGSKNVVQVPGLTRTVFARPLTRNAAFKSGESAFFEGVRALRRLLIEQSEDAEDATIIGVFSALQAEGRTVFSIALARAFSLVGHRVLLIDGDLRNHGVQRALACNAASRGLGDLIENPDSILAEVVQPQKDMGFDVLLGGTNGSNAADMLESKRFSILLESLKADYDVVIIDTPALLAYPDGRKIAAQSDQHVLVSRYDQSPYNAIKLAAATLYELGAYRLPVALYNAPSAFTKG